MPVSNAERQRQWRKRQKLTPEVLMTRLFGQRLDMNDPHVESFAAEHGSKAVEFKGVALPQAVDTLISSVVIDGLKAAPFGWSLKQDGLWSRLQVHVLRGDPNEAG